MQEKDKHDHTLLGPAAFEHIYLKTQLQLKRLWLAVWVLLGINICAMILMCYLGAQGKVDPIIVKVDGNNQILDVERAADIDYKTISPELSTWFVEQFVRNARSVSIDGIWQRRLMEKSYAVTQSAATQTLKTFYSMRNPMRTAQTEVISITINSVIPNIGGSPHTTQVAWTEISHDPKSGNVLGSQRYTGQFTFQWKKPSKSDVIDRFNPLGFYINFITWTSDLSDNSGLP